MQGSGEVDRHGRKRVAAAIHISRFHVSSPSWPQPLT